MCNPRLLLSGIVILGLAAFPMLQCRDGRAGEIAQQPKAEAPVARSPDQKSGNAGRELRLDDQAVESVRRKFGVTVSRPSSNPYEADALYRDSGGIYWCFFATVEGSKGKPFPHRKRILVFLGPDFEEKGRLILTDESTERTNRHGRILHSSFSSVWFGLESHNVAVVKTEGDGVGEDFISSARSRVIIYSWPGKKIEDRVAGQCLSKVMLCRDGKRYALLYGYLPGEDESTSCSELFLEFWELGRGWFRSGRMLKRVSIGRSVDGPRALNSTGENYVVAKRGGALATYDYNGDLIHGVSVEPEEDLC